MRLLTAAPPRPGRGLRTVRRPVWLVTACLALAGASLALPAAALSFDPWAWLVWGREAVRLELDTTGGPSWKPLPVLVTSVLAGLGDLAPTAWLVLARAGGLLLVVGTFRLAHRMAGPAAGAVAAGVLILSPDPDPRFLRILAEGHAAPVAAAAAVWAVDRHLAGRYRTAFVLGGAVALMRPESWPLLGAYALWLWRRDPRARALVAAAGAALPVLWFGGDWWGAGDPLHGADAARVGVGGALSRLVDGGRTVTAMVVAPAWLAAGAAVVTAWRRRERLPVVLAAGAAVWCALVVGMAFTLGYAALSRFLLPAVAVVAALAGAGAVQLAAAVRPLPRARLIGAAIALATAPLVLPRVAGLDGVAGEVAARGRAQADLPTALERAGGNDGVLACGPVVVEGASLLRPAVAWHLDVPLRRVAATPPAGPSVAVVLAGGRQDRRLAALTAPQAELIARSDRWAVYAVGCVPDPA